MSLITFAPTGEGESMPGWGVVGGAPVQQSLKRTIVKAPPKAFTVQVLDPVKHGSAYSYGIRVCPIPKEVGDNQSEVSGKTSSSSSSMTEYEVWRRWEDCLWFQELLEEEYAHMARIKRHRLAAGKGVKKDGLYKHPDQAASFDSLPPGPEVNSIAKHIHEIIPKLSKKGTLFRPSQALIDQRAKEFKAMIEGLFEEDVPTLVKELRDDRIIRDFFAVWRRDKDRERKMNANAGTSFRSGRNSVASSAFSMYFSASNISLQLPNACPDLPSPTRSQYKRESNANNVSSTSSRPTSIASTITTRGLTSAPATMSFTVNKHGSLASAALSDIDYDSSSHLQPGRRPRAMSLDTHLQDLPSDANEFDADVPIDFSLNDGDWPQSAVTERHNMLESLPEEEEVTCGLNNLSFSSDEFPLPTPRAHESLSGRRNSNRNAILFSQEPAVLDPDTIPGVDGYSQDGVNFIDNTVEQKSPASSDSTHASGSSTMSDRSSWRTSVASMTSFAPSTTTDYLEEAIAEVEQVWSDSDRRPSPRHAPRDSIMTMDSVLSDTSLEALIPRRFMQSGSSGLRRSLSAGSQRHSIPFALPIEEAWNEQSETLDASFYDPALRSASPNRPQPSVAIPEEVVEESLEAPQTPGRERISQTVTRSISTPEHYPKPFQNRPPGQFHLPWTPESKSPATSVASSPLSTTTNVTFTVKAVLGNTAVLVRATHSMSLNQIREKISEKYASQEATTLPQNFVVAITTSASMKAPRGRPRSNSTSAVGLINSSGLRYIATEFEWQELISTCSGKLALRIVY